MALQVKARPRRIRSKYILGTTLKANEVAAAIYRDFLPNVLADSRYVAAPKPSVVGHGVADFQLAMDIQLKGVSAAKVVVTSGSTRSPPQAAAGQSWRDYYVD